MELLRSDLFFLESASFLLKYSQIENIIILIIASSRDFIENTIISIAYILVFPPTLA